MKQKRLTTIQLIKQYIKDHKLKVVYGKTLYPDLKLKKDQ